MDMLCTYIIEKPVTNGLPVVPVLKSSLQIFEETLVKVQNVRDLCIEMLVRDKLWINIGPGRKYHPRGHCQ